MLKIKKEQFNTSDNLLIHSIEDIISTYIVESIQPIFPEADLYDLVYIYGYETLTQNPRSDINITINLSNIDASLENKHIGYNKLQERELDGYFEEIEVSLNSFLIYFNSEFDIIIKELTRELYKVVDKGYTLVVVSWENDGDDYATNSVTVESIEEAKVYYELMSLCEPWYAQSPGVIKLGNSESFSSDQLKVIKEFLFKNSELLNYDLSGLNEEYTDIIDDFQNYIVDFLGYSEELVCRVVESCIVTYSDKDVYVKKVKL